MSQKLAKRRLPSFAERPLDRMARADNLLTSANARGALGFRTHPEIGRPWIEEIEHEASFGRG